MNVPQQTLDNLQCSGHTIATPFRFELPDSSQLHCTTVLRLLPGKRIVLRAEHAGKIVLAKIFYDVKNWQKEINGYGLLQQTGVLTPALLASHPVGQGGVCLYEFIDDADPLDKLWKKSGTAKKSSLLDMLLATLQQCYQHKVLQQDLHLGNFLLQDKQLSLLDPASCIRFNSTATQQENLALLLAQLPFADWAIAQEKCRAMFPALAGDGLTQLARQCWHKRQQDYLKKVFRECSDIADISAGSLRILCQREWLAGSLGNSLRDPAALTANANVLKNGNSAKVFLTETAGKKIVIKQYINKDWLRKIRRSFRPSRAARSWYFAHAFNFAGIHVPAPVALIEQKSGPFVTSAWFISEYSAGQDLLSCWQEREPTVEELACIHDLFLSLQIIRTSHGDMKATNLIADGGKISLIDYDGAKEHHNARSLLRAMNQDKQRFLQNWSGNVALQEKLTGLMAL